MTKPKPGEVWSYRSERGIVNDYRILYVESSTVAIQNVESGEKATDYSLSNFGPTLINGGKTRWRKKYSLPPRKIGQQWRWDNGKLTAIYEIISFNKEGNAMMKMVDIVSGGGKLLNNDAFEYANADWDAFQKKWTLVFDPDPDEKETTPEPVSEVIVI